MWNSVWFYVNNVEKFNQVNYLLSYQLIAFGEGFANIFSLVNLKCMASCIFIQICLICLEKYVWILFFFLNFCCCCLVWLFIYSGY